MLSRLLLHEALFQKLYTLGIKGNFFQLIRNMYTHAKFVVKKDHTITDPSILGKGVRQGVGLTPILFNIFINDIDSIFSSDTCFPVQLIDTKLNCLLYADDLLLLSESKEGLQSCLKTLSRPIVTDGS
jgi:hypothetical protein